jgi:glycosyltransferase involved in cell wall biosynthesis
MCPDAGRGPRLAPFVLGHRLMLASGTIPASRFGLGVTPWSHQLRIAHVLQSFALGGGERVALELAGHQARSGESVWAVSLADDGDAPLAHELRDRRVETRTVPKHGRTDPTVTARLASWLAARRIDVVHTHNPLSLIYAAPAARLAGARVVHTMHGEAPDLPRRMWLRRMAAKLVDAYVVVSADLAEAARKREGVPAERIVVIENGIDVERFHADAVDRLRARAELGLSGDEWVVGTAARLSPEKDQTTLIRAIAPLLDGRTRLVVAGEGPEHETLQALVLRLGIGDRVRFLGAISDVAHFLRALDAFVLSSRLEALPLAVLEAMATGLPVVATAVGGLPRVVVSDETGVIVPPGDAEALREALVRLRDRPELARDLGRRARTEVLDRFSAWRMEDEYSALYTSLIAGRA